MNKNQDNSFYVAMVCGLIFFILVCVSTLRDREEIATERIEAPKLEAFEDDYISRPVEVLDDVLEDDSKDCTDETVEETLIDVEEAESVVIETVEAVGPSNNVEYFDVPLDMNLQDHIFRVCENYGIESTLIFAIIDKESKFVTDAIGDNGNAFGLMQIQPRWHQDRMERLGCKTPEELLDPYKNVTVGIDYLAELIGWDRGLDWAIMAYNGGPAGANKKTKNVVNYYNSVMDICENLK